MTRTSRARIFPLTLTNELAEEELRGEKGRLKTPSSVEVYPCDTLDDFANRYLARSAQYLAPISGFCKSNYFPDIPFSLGVRLGNGIR